MRLFVAHFTVLEEDLWFAAGTFTVERKAERYRLVSQLFAAEDSEAAYEKAMKMVEGMSDANCDGAGDRTNIRSIGIYELEEVDLVCRSLSEAINEPYGLDVGCVQWPETTPCVQAKGDLSLFKAHGT